MMWIRPPARPYCGPMSETTAAETARRHSIAVLPGDGIGPEVVAEAVKVLDAVTELAGITLELSLIHI